MEQDWKDRACRLAAQLVIVEQLFESEDAERGSGLLKMAVSAAAGNAHSLAHALSVTDEDIHAAAEGLRGHKAYQGVSSR